MLYYLIDVPTASATRCFFQHLSPCIEGINSTTCSIVHGDDPSEREWVITELLDVFETSSKL